MNKKLIRITTVPMSFKYLLKGQMNFMSKNGFNVTMICSDGQELNDVIENEKLNTFKKENVESNLYFHPSFSEYLYYRFFKGVK